jgi:hypothetical protein
MHREDKVAIWISGSDPSYCATDAGEIIPEAFAPMASHEHQLRRRGNGAHLFIDD